ncbi:MAG: transposase [Deltaproteobacteria bacterium]|jgi:transposase|nr:transposase [Deltaproteobacteria bacterium]
MSSLTYHHNPNGVTYVYRQESYWDKAKKRPSSRQVCVGKLDANGQIIYNQRFKNPEAREALERGETVAEALLIGQSLVLAKATKDTGLERVLLRHFESREANALLSLSWAMAAGRGEMDLANIWLEENDCPAHKESLSSYDLSRILASASQSQIDDFLGEWTKRQRKGSPELDCYDLTLASSNDPSNPFEDWGDNHDKEDLSRINMALLVGLTSRVPTYYALRSEKMSDAETIASFIKGLKKYKAERVRVLLDYGFYSAANISLMLEADIGFCVPAPTTAIWPGEMIDKYREAVEMPEHMFHISVDEREALYGMTVQDKIDGRRVWKHLYFDTARRVEHIASLFAALRRWEIELLSGETKEKNKWAYERYFTVKTTPKRGLKVTRKQEAINAYKSDRVGYWVILSNREKDATAALAAYRARALVESRLSDLKKDLAFSRARASGASALRGRAFAQFLALILTARIRSVMTAAWKGRMDIPKEDRLSRRYSLAEMMALLGSYRQTRFSARYGVVVSAPTKAQRSIFRAFGIAVV